MEASNEFIDAIRLKQETCIVRQIDHKRRGQKSRVGDESIKNGCEW